jgi:hypothetical protein
LALKVGQGWASEPICTRKQQKSMESWKHNDKTSHETITSTEFHWDFVPPLVFQLYSFAPGRPQPCSVAFTECKHHHHYLANLWYGRILRSLLFYFFIHKALQEIPKYISDVTLPLWICSKLLLLDAYFNLVKHLEEFQHAEIFELKNFMLLIFLQVPSNNISEIKIPDSLEWFERWHFGLCWKTWD